MRTTLARTPWLLLALAAVALAGCGGRKTYPVKGQVVFKDGTPARELAGYAIMFECAEQKVGANGVIDRETLKPKFDSEGKFWRIHNAQASQSLSAGGDWLFKAQLSGFKKSAGMRRQARREGGTETTHFVFTDGLASISVFIEPLAGQKAEKATYSVGAINVYKRVSGKHLLTVLGEVPMATLMRLGDGMEPKKK